MSELNFELTTDLSVVKNFVLDANFEEMEAGIREMMAPYQNMVVTEETIPGAKKDRAEINRIKKRIEDMRKEVERVYSEPMKHFKERCKPSLDMLSSAAGNLDGQIKGFEEDEKQRKIGRIKEYYDKAIVENGVADYMDWGRVYDPKWGNKTVKEETAHETIAKHIAVCKAGVEGVKGLNSPFETELLLLFKRTGDLAACLSRNSMLVQMKENEERKKREAAEEAARLAEMRAAREAQEKAEAEARAARIREKLGVAPEPVAVEPAVEKPVVEKPVPQMASIVFRVTGTNEQLMALSNFMQTNGIRFERA